ncbi:TerD family protein [Bacillus cihuensis]|uniref:TerD family protein n=1 Tax=Bacillus cihuensis TaxID=1208599 RepID=UPI000410A410|nr:TerD family protein [Bacillus cihuensis]
MKLLKKGEKYPIESSINNLDIDIGWSAPANYDMDVSAFLLEGDGLVHQDSNMIFYNNPSSSDQSVIRLNPTLIQKEQFKVNLACVSKSIQKVSFVLTIHESAHTKQTFQYISMVHLQIRNGDNSPILSFTMNGPFSNETALILFELYRYQDHWKINPVGSGFYGGLADVCKDYGLSVYEPTHSTEMVPLQSYPYQFSGIEQTLYEKLINRLSSFQINLNNMSMKQAQKVIQFAFEQILHKDHYLERSISSQEYQISYLNGHNTIDIKMLYQTTKEQELIVDRKISEIIKTVPMHVSAPQKVKFIHDFIVQHVDYDQSLTEYTAYAALVKRRTVCQGYAQLAYRLLNEIGVETLIIRGEAKVKQLGTRAAHAWNMVKVNGDWFHLDCTWDDPIGSEQIHYDYFLISDLEIRRTHSWESRKYPKAPKNSVHLV